MVAVLHIDFSRATRVAMTIESHQRRLFSE
ncbi:hypothetical protein PMI16_01813 [Herbaspirillum sp. CF444]|nr:hypothetical protein PMI16_01813 [Herbaspirillum sp. CF444]